jgi:hypothetical protein
MRFLHVFFLLKALLFFACVSAEEDLAEIQLVDDLRIEQLPDSSFLIGVRSVFIDHNKVYLADSERNQVVVFDENGSFVSSIGQLGRGPGELLGPGQLYINNDTLFVFSGGKHAIDLFSNNQFVKTIPFSDINGMYTGGRFFVDSGEVFISMVDLNGCISAIPINSIDENRSFGQLTRFSTDKQTIIQNHRKVFLHRNKTIAVSFFQPIIERYSKDGKLLEKFSYENLELISPQIQKAREQLSAENVAICLAVDAYIYKNYIYVLLCYSDNDRAYSNKILLIDLSGESMKLKKLLDLGPGWFTTIGVSGENIWAFRSDAHMRYLARFPLKSQEF